MTSAFLVPLVNKPQTLSVSLSGTTYVLSVRWNYAAQTWVLDLTDVNDVSLLAGVPLVTGVDLLGQYAYLGLPGKLIVQTTDDTDAVPTFVNLGTTGNLYYVVTP